MTTPKTLVIGSNGHKHVRCVAWKDIAAVNLKEFDVIVANVRSLSDNFLKQCEQGFFDATRSALSAWLSTGGELIVLGDNVRHAEAGSQASITNYSWLPVHIGIASEEGSSIAVKTSQYEKFTKRFSASGQWQFYYFIPQPCLSNELKQTYGQIPDTEYKIALDPIAENRAQEALSGIIEISVRAKDSEEIRLNPIVLLPCISGLEEREAVSLVLEDKLSLPQETLPPAWTETVPMPLVDDIQLAIEEKKKAIAALEQEIAANQEDKQKLEGFKKLLYGSGRELGSLFADCLELLGAKVTPAKHSDEEFVLEYKSQLYLVGCRGTQKNITLTPVRQLMDYMLTFEEQEGYGVKGLLFGNAWNTLPPEHRGHIDTVIFPDSVIEKAEALNIALLSSVSFFDEFCDFLAGKITGEEMLDNIVGTAGLVDFVQTQPSEHEYQ